MNIKTKKYQLESKTYITMAMKSIMVEFWWAWLIPIAMIVAGVFIEGGLGWFFWIAIVLSILYVLFWLIQFAGLTQMEQSKFLFEPLSYQINSQQVMLMLNAKQGMPMKWESIKSAKKTKNSFILYLSKVQFIHLPFTVFRSENDRKILETILRRKGYLKSAPAEKQA